MRFALDNLHENIKRKVKAVSMQPVSMTVFDISLVLAPTNVHRRQVLLLASGSNQLDLNKKAIT